MVGDDYAYPFSGVREVFSRDDFTFVNLECALTDHDVPADKTYRFRGLPEYGAILTEGSVEAVSLANNHSQDYGSAGLKETRQVLEALGVAAGGDGETFLYTTERGLRVGVYTAYHIGKQGIRQAISSLQEQGAEVIVAAFHAGTEGAYQPTDFQRQMFRYAAECWLRRSSITAIPMCSSLWSIGARASFFTVLEISASAATATPLTRTRPFCR